MPFIEPIAHYHGELPSKFGVPRQSGLVRTLKGSIIFCEKYRNIDALRGLEDFSHLWLIWDFSANQRSQDHWQALVRPPRLGGNKHVGVFATRSPFRPNGIGLSAVELEGIEWNTPQGPVLHVLGADLMHHTPIYDIKPYVAYADAYPQARCGFVDRVERRQLKVTGDPLLLEKLSTEQQTTLFELLAQDPRPAYQHDESRIYGLSFGAWNIRFRVIGSTLIIEDIQ